jgi:type III pantothenate kinase
MNLVVDLGNSRMKWACAQGDALTERACVPYEAGDLPQVLNAQWKHLGPPAGVFVANVRGRAVGDTLRAWVAERWGQQVDFVAAVPMAHGVHNAYMDPARLGADRWVALIAVHRLYGEHPACIVDCGTAVTIDALSESGEHMGGLILPGLTMMRRALVERTDGIGEVASGRISLLARSTQDGVTAGTLYTLVAAIDRIAGDVTAELGIETMRIMTGGDAEIVLPLLEGPWKYEPDLVLRGLAAMAQG